MLQPGATPRKLRADQLARRPAAGAGSLAEPGSGPHPAAAPGPKPTVMLRCSSAGSSAASSDSGSLTLDNKNPSKLVVKPDGNILWEMPTDARSGPPVATLLQGAAELALMLSAASSGVMGIAVAVVELKRASEQNYCVTSQHLARIMAMTVSSSFAGTVAGLVYAPLLAARLVCGRIARPAALVGACWAATRGVLRVLTLRGLGPAALLRQLEDAALALGGSCLEAAEKVAERAAASPRWRRAFIKLGGVDALLRLLRNGLDGEGVAAVMRALAELLREEAAQTVLVAHGGVPHLLLGLSHADPAVSCACSEMLARLARNGPALHAIREAGGVAQVLQLLPAAASPTQQLHLLALVSGLASSSEASSAELADAGSVEVLLRLVVDDPLPRTPAKEAALSTLHALVASSPAHFAALAGLPGASHALAGVAAAYEGRWYASKAALASLSARLAAAEAAAAAPIAGDIEELVELPA